MGSTKLKIFKLEPSDVKKVEQGEPIPLSRIKELEEKRGKG